MVRSERELRSRIIPIFFVLISLFAFIQSIALAQGTFTVSKGEEPVERVPVVIRAIKNLDGRRTSIPFIFELKSAEGDVLLSGQNDANGEVHFRLNDIPDLEWLTGDVYTFKLSEKIPADDATYDYDDTEYTITVRVYEPPYPDAVIISNNQGNKVDLMVFSNAIADTPTPEFTDTPTPTNTPTETPTPTNTPTATPTDTPTMTPTITPTPTETLTPTPRPTSTPVTLFPLDPGAILPETGFSAVRPQTLPEKPLDLNYAPLGWTLQIPSLSVMTDIVTVPAENGRYVVTWLEDHAGLPEGFALPGENRTVITGHNHLNTMEAGPFAFLNELEMGDRIFILDPEEELTIYAVYANEKIAEDDISGLNRISNEYERSISFITCEDERVEGGYQNRRIVAVRPVG